MDFLDVLNRRYACKHFNRERNITISDIRYLAECGRLSPTSFGLEGWKFIFVESANLLESLALACGNQDPMKTCTLACVILARKPDAFMPGSGFLKERASRFPGGYEVFIEDYRGYHEFLENEGRTDSWARSQTYIACTSMMAGAAAKGIDSCAIEGFNEEKIIAALGIDSKTWSVGILLALGYRDEPVRPKIRASMEELVEIR